VWQWLGIIIGIGIALLLTLPLSFCVCPHSSCCHSVQLHCMSCHCVGGCIVHCAMAFLPCEGMPWHCSLSCGIILCSMALHVVPWPCSLYCSIVLCAAAFCIVPWHYALWCGIMHHVRHFASCCRHCTSCRSIGDGIAWSSNSTARTTFAPFTFVEKMEKQSTGSIGDSVRWWLFDATWLSRHRIENKNQPAPLGGVSL